MYKKIAQQLLDTDKGGSKEVRTDCILKTKDDNGNTIVNGMFIPFAEANVEYEKYLAWVAKGNTPDPAD